MKIIQIRVKNRVEVGIGNILNDSQNNLSLELHKYGVLVNSKPIDKKEMTILVPWTNIISILVEKTRKQKR